MRAIATGAPVPPDLDCVIQHEWTNRSNPVSLRLPHAVEPDHAIHPRGADAREGDELIPEGTRLAAHHLGIAASVGQDQITCWRPPRITILTSGDEVRPYFDDVEPHQIRQLQCHHAQQPRQQHGRRRSATPTSGRRARPDHHAVREALQASDLIITVGGISAGKRDHFHDAYEALNIDRTLGGAAIQPGKPITIGKTTNEDGSDCWIVSLPGNPVSSLACACLFIWPMIEIMLGRPGDLPWRDVVLDEAVRPNARRQAYRPATLCGHDRSRVCVPKWAGSGDLAHTAATDGLAELPVQQDEVQAGTTVRFLPWPSCG